VIQESNFLIENLAPRKKETKSEYLGINQSTAISQTREMKFILQSNFLCGRWKEISRTVGSFPENLFWRKRFNLPNSHLFNFLAFF
jgi:hypothetical protein